MQQRLKMWLRSEKALGLESVRGGHLLGEMRVKSSNPRELGNAPRDVANVPPRVVRAVVPVEPSAIGKPAATVGLPSTPRVVLDQTSVKSSKSDAPVIPGFSLFGSASGSTSSLTVGLNTQPFEADVLPREKKILALAEMDAHEVKGCTRCRLCEARIHTVFGEGDPDADVFFIGEGPGENEDETGRPFVGRAGVMLDTMIKGMGLSREKVFIANIVKCRPPQNREPMPDEVATCTPYLQRQLEIVRPKVIVTLGKPAAQHMLGSKLAMNKLRGIWQSWRGIELMPTYHPAYVVRNYTSETRAAVWSDLKQVLELLGLPIPGKKNSE